MLSLKLGALILSLISSFASGAPLNDVIALEKRSDGTKSSPRQAIFRIEGWEDLADINCYIMLCIVKTSVL